MILSILKRLEETIEAETAALLSHDMSQQEDFNRRKSQSLLELGRIGRSALRVVNDVETVACLERIRTKLGRNHEVVGMNLRAIQEVADIVTTMIRSGESDGTYSPVLRQWD